MTIQDNTINIPITEHYKSLPSLSTEGLDALVQFLLYAQSKGELEMHISPKSDVVA